MTYRADAIPTIDDFNSNIVNYDTWQNKPLLEGGNVFDITAGLQYALANNYTYFGVLIWVPSSNIHVMMQVDPQATITIDGTAIPPPAYSGASWPSIPIEVGH
jgi:hypothetical protein